MPRFILQRADLRLNIFALLLEVHQFHMPIVDLVAPVGSGRLHGISVQYALQLGNLIVKCRQLGPQRADLILISLGVPVPGTGSRFFARLRRLRASS
jgi:hypothetical protein